MLDPDELNIIGDGVAAVYQQIEAEMIAELAHACAEGSRMSQRVLLDIAMLSQTDAAKLREIVESHREEVDRSILETAQHYLALSDAADIAILHGAAKFPSKVQATVKGLQAWTERLDLEMPIAAQRLYTKSVTQAAVKLGSARISADEAVREAARTMADEGIEIVQYSTSGKRAYRMSTETAVRNQVRVQMTRASQEMTMERIRESGAGLVEVSSHVGARPSHAEWQGRVYSLNGPVTIDGVYYPDYNTSCHVGDLVDGIFGYNCRHSVMPYVHGTPRTFNPDPEHSSGLSNDEYYKLTQEQRARERGIREAKRRVKAAEAVYEVDGGEEAQAELQRQKSLLKSRQASMREFIKQANASAKPGTQVLVREYEREWIG